MWTRPALALSLLLAGCYASHGRGLADGERDGAVPRFDGSTSDAGVRDAGPRDAGPRDAGPRDADVSDVGLVDAMLPSVPDAGLEPGTVDGDYYTFCMRLARVFCDGNARCCELPDRVHPEGDETACYDLLAAGCTRSLDELAALRDRVQLDSVIADEYLRELIRAAPGCGEIRIPAEVDVLRGTVPRGGDCTPASVPGWGMFDSWEQYTCEPGLRCELSGTAPDHQGRCAELGERGDSCTYEHIECESGLYCGAGPRPFGATGTGTCVPPAGIGRSCDSDYGCTSFYCGQEGRCERGSATAGWCFML